MTLNLLSKHVSCLPASDVWVKRYVAYAAQVLMYAASLTHICSRVQAYTFDDSLLQFILYYSILCNQTFLTQLSQLPKQAATAGTSTNTVTAAITT
mmetsp:Transcript_19247/g.53879  ORF Transcript_19247/g.53879 Transcript_19247/m.53879 type:complete len:96 (+) Transcript_19247:646-933(+)